MEIPVETFDEGVVVVLEIGFLLGVDPTVEEDLLVETEPLFEGVILLLFLEAEVFLE